MGITKIDVVALLTIIIGSLVNGLILEGSVLVYMFGWFIGFGLGVMSQRSR